MIQCIAIDQDASALALLKKFFEQIPYIRLDRTFSDLTEANLYLLRHSADLIITDTEVKQLDTFELIEEFKQKTQVIILTDSCDKAYAAFEAGVTDYMLKPLRFERLLKATNRVFDLMAASGRPDPAAGHAPLPPLFVKEGNKIIRLRKEEILFLEGYGDYVKIHLRDGKPLLSQMSLKKFEATLPDNNFCRVHRSFIVAISQINYIEKKRIRIGKELIPISESYLQAFLNRLELQ